MGEESIDFETVLQLYTDQQRRTILAIFAEEQRPLTLRDLLMTVLEHNHHTTLAEASQEMISQTQDSLHHDHLPDLASAGVVDYDPKQSLVRPTERFDEILPTLSVLLDADPDFDGPVGL